MHGPRAGIGAYLEDSEREEVVLAKNINAQVRAAAAGIFEHFEKTRQEREIAC